MLSILSETLSSFKSKLKTHLFLSLTPNTTNGLHMPQVKAPPQCLLFCVDIFGKAVFVFVLFLVSVYVRLFVCFKEGRHSQELAGFLNQCTLR